MTHWSSRLQARRLGLHHVAVAAAWKSYGVKPWKAEKFTVSTDPELEAKVTAVIGLYLHPPQNAVVLCVDEKALNRTQKVLPMQPGTTSSEPMTTSGTAPRRCSPPWRSRPGR